MHQLLKRRLPAQNCGIAHCMAPLLPCSQGAAAMELALQLPLPRLHGAGYRTLY
jgi:hypothetical protein